MPLIIGVSLALAVGALANAVQLDRDRAFYPTVTIGVASYYVLFAVLGASAHTLFLESLAAMVFLLSAVYGFRSSLWVVVAALAGHAIFDFVHGSVLPNPGVPAWWSGFCGAYDITAAGYLAWLLGRGRIPAAAEFRPLRATPSASKWRPR